MLSNFTKKNGVYYITEKKNIFSSTYIEVRNKEKRVYEDSIVRRLPLVSKNHTYFNEWKLRQKSTKRIVDYLINKNKPLKILDLGCGNGWFSNQLSKIPNAEIYATDINHIELEQAARVFKHSNLKFLYADIFSFESNILHDFDMITVNSCIQYFENLDRILKRLKSILISEGELHILDSPFYKSDKTNNAKERTKEYYQQLGVPEMADHYFHHSLDNFNNYKIMYQSKKGIINKLLIKKDSPFMWLMFSNGINS